MLSKFSVRKPMTVLVAVILVIVLGVISFTRMTTDLLPEMELPYVIVITPTPGESPEMIEQTVTRPLESALGTAGGLNSMNSISNENTSVIILEFVQDTNMDSAMIELSGMLDQVSGMLDDNVGSPMLLKISPDMLPVVVASVDVSEMSIEELSRFSDEEVIPAFERIEGVASVDVSGLVEERLEIVLDEDKIDQINTRVQEHIQESLDENLEQLEDAKSELESGRETLESETGSQTDRLAQASVELNSAIANLNALLSEEAMLEAQMAAFQAEKAFLEELIRVEHDFEELLPEGETELTRDNFEEFVENWNALYGPMIEELTFEDVREMLTQGGVIALRIATIDIEIQNITTRQSTLEAMKPELESALAEAQAGMASIESGKIMMASELAQAQMQIKAGEDEIDKGFEAFETAREQALAGADLHNIITHDMVEALIGAQNFNMPAGYLGTDSGQHLIKVGDEFASVEEIVDMVLFNIEPVGDIRLSDISHIEMTDNSGESYTRVNGNDAVILTFQKQSTASTTEVTVAISEEIDRLENEYEGLSIRPLMDQGDYIFMITGSVMQNLIIGGLLAILLLLLFLRDVRPTIVIVFSIPISLMFAVTLMYFSNVTLNMISLAGLALGVGMLVDNSIVVIENIYRMRSQGVSAAKASVEGAKQVSGAIFASTLTTICVFLPIVFTQGISRQLFTDMGLTIAYSLTASLIVALTLVPAMGATVLRKNVEKKHNLFDRVIRGYVVVLKWALRRKAVILSVVIALLIVSVFGIRLMGTAFIPPIDSPQMTATLTIPEGYSQEESYALNDEIMEIILEIDDVEAVGGMSGNDQGMAFLGMSSEGTTYYILLEKDRQMSNVDVEREIYARTEHMNVDVAVDASNMDMSALGGSGIQVNVHGQDLDVLAKLSEEVAVLLREVEGTTHVETGLEDAEKETRIIVDKDKAMREGLTVAQVYMEISQALETEKQATILNEENNRYPVVVVNLEQEGITQDNLFLYSFSVTDHEGNESSVFLGDIAEIYEADTLQSIRRENQSRHMTVNANIADGYNIGLVSRDVEDALSDFVLPDGYSIILTGENEMIQEALGDLVLMILLAVVFIYLIMVAQFQDLLSPFIVLFTLPLAFTGGLLLLWAVGLELSVLSVLGFLVLAGIVVNNAIVFVSYVNQLRLSGMSQHEALVATGAARIRPIMMTALTTILAMGSLSLGFGDGAEIMQPMAVVAVGGLTYATFLTLLVVPILYDLFHKKPMRRIEVDDEDTQEEVL